MRLVMVLGVVLRGRWCWRLGFRGVRLVLSYWSEEVEGGAGFRWVLCWVELVLALLLLWRCC